MGANVILLLLVLLRLLLSSTPFVVVVSSTPFMVVDVGVTGVESTVGVVPPGVAALVSLEPTLLASTDVDVGAVPVVPDAVPGAPAVDVPAAAVAEDDVHH